MRGVYRLGTGAIMCQATVYLGDKEVAREVIGLEEIDEGVRLMTFFEAPQVVAGRIRYIDFLKHRVQLQPLEKEE
jgi:predicted RNA-binding protein